MNTGIKWYIIIILTCIVYILFPLSLVHATCPLPDKQSVNIGANTCTVASINGVDVVSGNNNIGVITLNDPSSLIQINNGGMLRAGSFVINNGSIALQGTGKLETKTPIFVPDADGDGYPANLTLEASARSGVTRLGSLISLTLDCNDSIANSQNTCCVALGGACNNDADCCAEAQYCGTDADNDGYFAVAASGTCGTTNKVHSDCNDQSNLVWISAAPCYRDIDGDGETRGTIAATNCRNNATCTSVTQAGAAGDGQSVTVYTAGRLKTSETANVDCCDSHANVNHSVTSYSTSSFTCTDGIAPTPLAYDYNCSGGNEQLYTTPQGACCQCQANSANQSCPVVAGTCKSGWNGIVPACGASDTYWNNGYCDEDGSLGDYPSCSVRGCSTYTETQACR